MAQIQEVWKKFNSRERQIATGAGLLVVGWVISLLDFGVGSNIAVLIGAIVLLGLLYIEHGAASKPNLPAPLVTILVIASAIVALLAIIAALSGLGWLRFGVDFYLLASIATGIGGALVAWGAWQVYQVEKPALPNFSAANTTTATPAGSPPAPGAAAAPSAPAPVEPAPSAPPPAATDDTLPR